MATITDLARPATIEGPQDPALAQLWALALAKFLAAEGREPATRADWRQVTMDYGRLLSKPHGTLTQIVTERCSEVRDGD
jgi:hypothetical protein